VLFSTYSITVDRQDRDVARVSEECATLSACQEPAGAVTLPVDGIVWQELCREAERQRVQPQELAAFALSYYLADADSGRIARRVPAAAMGARAAHDGGIERQV
jgi:hypothetical protein